MDHGKPFEGAECACCMEDIDEGNYVEYRTGEGKKWLPSLFCKECIQTLIKRQWPIYEESLAKATCKAQQKRMLGEGPPTHVKDKTALKCEEGESVHSLWYVGDGDDKPQIQSALLEGAPQGEARQIWWDEKLAFQFDEDDEEEEEKGPAAAAAAAAAATASTPPPVPGTASPSPVPPVPAAPADNATVRPASGAESEAVATASSPVAESGSGGVAATVGEGAAETPSKMDVEEESAPAAAAAEAGAASTAATVPAASAVPLA